MNIQSKIRSPFNQRASQKIFKIMFSNMKIIHNKNIHFSEKKCKMLVEVKSVPNKFYIKRKRIMLYGGE